MEASEIIKKIRKIEITTKSLVSEIFSGEYHSLFKGQGLEFSEVREYQSGDSFRQIDWNVSARMNHPYIKKFEETRELNVIFMIDCSASTVLGTRNSLKSELITEIAGVLSFSALSNNDKVGLTLFSDQIEKYIPPRKGKKTALRILREILYFDPQSNKTGLKNAIEYIYRITKKKSIIFLISDFLDKDYEKPLKLLSRKHDVIAIRVIDPIEIKLPDAGLLYLKDWETGEIFTINTSNKKIREKYSQLILEEEEILIEKLKKMKIDLLTIRTDQEYVKALIKFFKMRIKRKNNA